MDPWLHSQVLGIDLGTTNSVMAAVEAAVPTVLPNSEVRGESRRFRDFWDRFLVIFFRKKRACNIRGQADVEQMPTGMVLE